MTKYLADIWRLRHFWLSLVRMDLRNRYSRSWLGFGWSLLHPIAMTAIICTVFHRLFGMDIREYGPSLLAGLCFWNFVTGSAVAGCHALLQGEHYIRQFPAPIAIYPLRTVLGAAFHCGLALAVVLVLRWGLKGFGDPRPLVAIVPTLALLFLFGWALATLSSLANAYFPDTQHLLEVAFQILFYGTPIIYPPEVLRSKGLAWIVDWNPLAAFLELIRAPLLAGEFPSFDAVLLATGTVALLVTASAALVARLQRTIVFQL